MTRLEIMDLINKERERQDKLHPTFPSMDSNRFAILAEETGEVAKAINEDDPVRSELVQVAAVAIRWLEHL